MTNGHAVWMLLKFIVFIAPAPCLTPTQHSNILETFLLIDPHKNSCVERVYIFVSILEKKNKDERVRVLCQATQPVSKRCWNNPFYSKGNAPYSAPLQLPDHTESAPECVCLELSCSLLPGSQVIWLVTLCLSNTHREVFCAPSQGD